MMTMVHHQENYPHHRQRGGRFGEAVAEVECSRGHERSVSAAEEALMRPFGRTEEVEVLQTAELQVKGLMGPREYLCR